VIVAVPAATPVTTPVEAFTVATPAVELDQLPPDTVEEKVVVEPAQTFWLPLSMPAVPDAETVSILVEIALAQVPDPKIVYVITTVPVSTPNTTPVEESTVATKVLLLDQLPPVTVEVKIVVPRMQTFWLPLIMPALKAATVTVLIAVTLAQPPVPATV
jgi:hypothetical protein